MEDRRRGNRHVPPVRSGPGLAAPDPRVGKVLDNRYRLLERLAAGGMGVVYRAERLGLARQVAVKFLHRSSANDAGHRARFEREAAAMSRVTHPNLVSIIDYGSWDQVPYLVMDYYPGITLRKAVKDGPMEPRRAVFVTRQILAGIGSAHASGVVHRDLKPANVLLVGSPGEDLVKILDFGVAKLIEGDGGPSDLSAVAGYVLGTPEYMAPEQARSERIDHRTDIYAVGVLLYEMLTGRLPFQAEGDLAILHKHIEEPPPRPRSIVPAISPELESVTLCALEKSPSRRWQSAVDFSRALTQVPEGSAAPPRPTSPAVAQVESDATRPAPPQASAPRRVRASRAQPPPPPPGRGTAPRDAIAAPEPPRLVTAGRAAPEPRFVAEKRKRVDRPDRTDTPGQPTVAARPVAKGRAQAESRRPRSRRRWPVFLIAGLVAAVTAAGGVWYAVQQGLVIEWPSWLPWS